MKIKHAQNIFITALTVFFLLYALASIFAIPAYKEYLVTSCETLELSHSSCVETSETSSWAINGVALIGSGVVSAFLAIPIYVLLSSLHSLFKKREVSEELKKYAYDHLVYHLIESSGGDMSKVEKKLAGIPDSDSRKKHFIEQYIEALPAEQRDAAVKRLIP